MGGWISWWWIPWDRIPKRSPTKQTKVYGDNPSLPPPPTEKFAPENIPRGKSSEPNFHFLETMLNFQVVTHFSLEKWTSCGRWEISPLLSSPQVELPLQFTGRNGSPLIQTPTNSCPAGRDDSCYPADVSRKKGEHPVNKTRMRMFFFQRGGVVVFLGGWRFQNPYPKKKRMFFFILSEERSLNNQEGSKFFTAQGQQVHGNGGRR